MADGAAPQRSASASGGRGQLGVSIAGLTRGGVDEALTTDQIQELLARKPEWLVRERETHAKVMAENARVKRAKAAPRS